MNKVLCVAAVAVLIASCQKKVEQAPVSGTDAAVNPPATAAAPTPQPTEADRKRAEKQAALDYATMEDAYLNDAKGQWAQTATASSVFGESGTNGASDVNKAQNIVGKPDDRNWTNDHQDMGFDTFEATFEKPVHATEVRVVFRDGIEAVSKLEVKGVDGAYTTVWSGINEDPQSSSVPRYWFVRKFAATTNPVQGVKITLANTVERGYKVVDAVQLVGE